METDPETKDKPTRLLTAALQEEYRTMAACQEHRKQAEDEYTASSRRAVELETAIEALAAQKNLVEMAARSGVKIADAADALIQLREILQASQEGRMSISGVIAHLEMLAARLGLDKKEATDAGGN
jgi:hypothetical protein